VPLSRFTSNGSAEAGFARRSPLPRRRSGAALPVHLQRQRGGGLRPPEPAATTTLGCHSHSSPPTAARRRASPAGARCHDDARVPLSQFTSNGSAEAGSARRSALAGV